MGDRQAEREQRVTPLELFFDLVFVFAITQVTTFLSHYPTWAGLLRGLLRVVLAGSSARLHRAVLAPIAARLAAALPLKARPLAGPRRRSRVAPGGGG